MSIIRNLAVNLPAACGVPDGLAKVYGRHNKDLFNFEKRNPNGRLNRKHFADRRARLQLGFKPWEQFAERGAYDYALDLMDFAAKTIDAGGKDWTGKKAKKAELQAVEPQFPKVARLLSVEQASTLGNWA